ncbi:MAG: hypothetical protein HYZ16_04435 [Bacteroidetes bacterium]|jgi:hypothetical protein|nr:hypothetical protein [Bacteroidota bacterium]
MKTITTTLLCVCLALLASGQTYYLKIDSAHVMKLKNGKTYTVKHDGQEEKLRFEALAADSFRFEGKSLHYKQITAIRNPKRKLLLDLVAFPVSIGSCIGLTTIPISYIKGYFLADTDMILTTVFIFVGETLVFSSTRNYLGKTKKWLPISDLETLEWGENT